MGAYHSTQNFEIFETGTNGTEISWENLEIVEFPKSEPFNGKFWKFQDENQMERTFPGNYVRKFGYTPQGCPLFGNSANSRFAIQR